jgi:uncharacterized protein DUF2188
MTNPGHRALELVPEGRGWAVRRPGRASPESRHLLLEAAERAARRQLRQEGGGELRVRGADGRIRDTATVAAGERP